jgi:hypothetical protein
MNTISSDMVWIKLSTRRIVPDLEALVQSDLSSQAPTDFILLSSRSSCFALTPTPVIMEYHPLVTPLALANTKHDEHRRENKIQNGLRIAIAPRTLSDPTNSTAPPPILFTEQLHSGSVKQELGDST